MMHLRTWEHKLAAAAAAVARQCLAREVEVQVVVLCCYSETLLWRERPLADAHICNQE